CQAVYRQVQNLLRLNIEIDTAKVDRQVAEISETEYFSQLQQRAKQLRQQRQLSRPTPSASETPPPDAQKAPSPDKED
ncbi:MAG: transmembrane sensor domain protein, partial [Leptolyngbya sp. SIO4C5]|nr:transmembrane sensor domain protein [Leptolyngbya sp. SIO4C5]